MNKIEKLDILKSGELKQDIMNIFSSTDFIEDVQKFRDNFEQRSRDFMTEAKRVESDLRRNSREFMEETRRVQDSLTKRDENFPNFISLYNNKIRGQAVLENPELRKLIKISEDTKIKPENAATRIDIVIFKEPLRALEIFNKVEEGARVICERENIKQFKF